MRRRETKRVKEGEREYRSRASVKRERFKVKERTDVNEGGMKRDRCRKGRGREVKHACV